MFSAKKQEVPSRLSDPMEGRLFEARGVGTRNLIDRCQEAIDAGAYTVLSQASPGGVVLQLDIDADTYTVAIALDPDTNAATILLLHRTNGGEELAAKMLDAAFGSI